MTSTSASFLDVVTVRAGQGTDRGLRRKVNEDAPLVAPPVFAVADGMGGHAAGDKASAFVVDELRSLQDRVVDAQDVTTALQAANDQVRALHHSGGAGTTVTGLIGVLRAGLPYWLVVNLGDSRAYRLMDGRLRQVSIDHSVVQELVDNGEIAAAEARTHPQRHVVTRAVGGPQDPEPDYWLLPAQSGERFLLCSDGLTTDVQDDRIADVLREHPDPQQAADALITAAITAGGRDNVTVVVVDVESVMDHQATDDAACDTVPRDGIEQTRPRPAVPVP